MNEIMIITTLKMINQLIIFLLIITIYVRMLADLEHQEGQCNFDHLVDFSVVVLFLKI